MQKVRRRRLAIPGDRIADPFLLFDRDDGRFVFVVAQTNRPLAMLMPVAGNALLVSWQCVSEPASGPVSLGIRIRVYDKRPLMTGARPVGLIDLNLAATANYRVGFMGSSPEARVTARFTRVSTRYLNWVIAIDDSKAWTAPWSFMMRLKRRPDQFSKYACHEANHSLPGIVGSARTEDGREAAAGKASK